MRSARSKPTKRKVKRESNGGLLLIAVALFLSAEVALGAYVVACDVAEQPKRTADAPLRVRDTPLLTTEQKSELVNTWSVVATVCGEKVEIRADDLPEFFDITK